jgi:hypothetical protein
MLEKTKDLSRLDICMLNNYLNRYTEKLSRGNTFNPNEIKLDQNNFTNVQNGASKSTVNPYLQF